MTPQLRIQILDNAEAEITAFARELLTQTPASFVEFQVLYPLGDQPRDEEWSSPDHLTVFDDGRIQAQEA